MKKKIKYLLAFFVLLQFFSQATAQDTIIRYKKVLIPNYINAQYAGNYGAYIIGGGYYLNAKHTLEFVGGYGYTTKEKAASRIHNVFVKGIFIPRTWHFKSKWSAAPTTGITMSRQFAGAGNTFVRLPKTYPDGYYAPNAFRFHFNFGLRARKYLNDYTFVKAIELYAETTTNDLYLTYLFKSNYVKMRHIFSIAIGVNIIIFDKN